MRLSERKKPAGSDSPTIIAQKSLSLTLDGSDWRGDVRARAQPQADGGDRDENGKQQMPASHRYSVSQSGLSVGIRYPWDPDSRLHDPDSRPISSDESFPCLATRTPVEAHDRPHVVNRPVAAYTDACEEDQRHHPRHRRPHAAGPDQPDHARSRDGRGAGQGRDLQPRQLDQGPHRRQDDRRCRARGSAEAGRHDRRRHVGQHRHGPGHRGRRPRLPLRLHHDRQAVEGEDRRAEGVRRRGGRLSDQRRSGRRAFVLFGVVAPRQGDSRGRGRPTSTTIRRTRPRTTSRPVRKSGSRPTAA